MTPGWERVKVEMEKVKETITCVFICMCVDLPATPPAGQGSAVGGSDWSSPAVQLAGVG